MYIKVIPTSPSQTTTHSHTHTPSLSHTHNVPSKTKGFEKEQRLVYQIIEDSGNKGIWMREIRSRSNITQSELTRCLRTLESRKLIKNVRSVQAARRKVREREGGRGREGCLQWEKHFYQDTSELRTQWPPPPPSASPSCSLPPLLPTSSL